MVPIDPHPDTAELGYLGVADILAGFGTGTLTSAGLVDALLDRITVVDDPDGAVGLAAVAGVAADARSVAAQRDAERARGDADGPLHGVPVMVKDNIEATGLPGAAGSTALAGRPAADAALVTRVRRAGAVVLASTNLSEWANIRSAHSTSGWSATGGLVGNPWALDRSAGGSSSGSGAALAAGLTPLAVGTETDGSIVCPCSVAGVVGLKPTVGAVPTAGVVPISASQDSPGPMGRSVDDVARLFAVLADVGPLDLAAPEPRFVHATTWRTGHPATDEAFGAVVEAVRRAGYPVTDRQVATPGPDVVADEFEVLLAELSDDLGAYLATRPGDGVRSLADVLTHDQARAEVELPYFGDELFARAVATGGRAGPGYAAARERNLAWAVTSCLGPALEDADVVVAPAYGPAWKSDLTIGGHAGVVSSWITTPAAIAGWPIMSVPVALVHGLPIGAALVARPGEEAVLLAAAARIESVVQAVGPLPRPGWRPPTRG